MKKNRMLRSIGLIDEKYVEEASPENAKNIRRRIKLKKYRPLMVAACFTIVLLSLAMWLFIPFKTKIPSVKGYSDSEYYPLIQKLNEHYVEPPEYYNNFDILYSKWLESKKVVASDSPTNEAPPSDSGSESSSYIETTDNQVEGIIEADLMKRSDKYVFYLNGNRLNVFTIAEHESTLVSETKIDLGISGKELIYDYYYGLYLSEDCNTVSVVCGISEIKRGSGYSKVYTVVFSYDVSEPEKEVKLLKKVTLPGRYSTSRMIDGKIYLISLLSLQKQLVDFSDEKTFAPQIDYGNGPESMPLSKIFVSENKAGDCYTLVTVLDPAKDMKLVDACALFAYRGTNLYISEDSLYIESRIWGSREEKEGISIGSVATIARIGFSGGEFEFFGEVLLDGFLNNQYSLDEYNGVLRAVVSIDRNYYSVHKNIFTGKRTLTDREEVQNASLYCIDISDMSVISFVERFAPNGERVRSVRFDKNAAYVCTSLNIKIYDDPVFFFDLTDLNNITVKDTGTIPGFSASLVNFGNGYLLGIGYGESRDTLKIEVYKEIESSVISVCKYEIEDCYFQDDYKAYLIDRENGFVGLGYSKYSGKGLNRESESWYVLLKFESEQLVPLTNIWVESFYNSRAFLLDGYLYVFNREGCWGSPIGK